MRATSRSRRRGSAMVEFALAGVASTVMLISTVAVSYGMWNYHTLAYSLHETTRYVAVHGKGCTNPGNFCAITVGNIAHRIAGLAIGVPAGLLNVKLTTDSGAETICNPVTSCYSSTTVWPPATNADNQLGKKFTISASLAYSSPLLFFWPGAGGQQFGTVVFPATSQQTIIY